MDVKPVRTFAVFGAKNLQKYSKNGNRPLQAGRPNDP
jgi:hypothetical protein